MAIQVTVSRVRGVIDRRWRTWRGARISNPQGEKARGDRGKPSNFYEKRMGERQARAWSSAGDDLMIAIVKFHSFYVNPRL